MSNSRLRKEIERVINSNSTENGSDTPDFILARYLTDCLEAFDRAMSDREAWYGRPRPRMPSATSAVIPPPEAREIALPDSMIEEAGKIIIQRNAGRPSNFADNVAIMAFEEVHQLRVALDAFQPEWLDISTAPKDGTWVLLFGDGPAFASCHFIGYYGIRSGYSDDQPAWRQTGWRGEPTRPTHWQPLPAPPQKDATDE